MFSEQLQQLNRHFRLTFQKHLAKRVQLALVRVLIHN